MYVVRLWSQKVNFIWMNFGITKLILKKSITIFSTAYLGCCFEKS